MTTIDSNTFKFSSSTALSVAAAGLSAGEWADVTKNTTQDQNDIQWMVTTIYYDAVRKEIQYMGKPASSQSTIFSHYIYSESADTWTRLSPIYDGGGHIWCHAFDDSTGDHYWTEYVRPYPKKFDRSAGVSLSSWSDIAPAILGSRSITEGGIGSPIFGYHPNLFGPGNPGIYVHGVWFPYCYNIATDTWSIHRTSSWPNPSPYRVRNNGKAVYLPGPDRLAIFGQGSAPQTSGTQTIWVEAGAGNTTDMLAEGYISHGVDEPPVLIAGKGAGVTQGHVLNHPSDPNRLLILEENGSQRVWDSTDYGSTWSAAKGYTHPFIPGSGVGEMPSAPPDEFTCGTIAPYGVVIGMTSSSTGGGARIWKPGD